MNKPSAKLGELALIQQIRRDFNRRQTAGVRLGIGDDCAILRAPRGHEIVVTTDFTLEGRHFRRDWHGPRSAGHRTLARGLSDLAAMGAKPLAAFLSLALPRGLEKRWISLYMKGLRELAERVGVPLAGGDTAQAPGDGVLADIVLLGTVPEGTALLRSGARAGDLLYCSGRLGGAAAELLYLQEDGKSLQGVKRGGEHPQLFPEPRLVVGARLRERGLATACIDLSDGLSSDLAHLCDASEVAAEIELSRIPVHPLAKGKVDLAVHGGEDYELLFAARPEAKMPRAIAGVPLTCIGRFKRRGKSHQMSQIAADGRLSELRRGGWEHFIQG
jgi:thiamine-monophosphate kinase